MIDSHRSNSFGDRRFGKRGDWSAFHHKENPIDLGLIDGIEIRSLNLNRMSELLIIN